MEQILLAHGLPKYIVTALLMLSPNNKVKVHLLGRDTDFFDIDVGVLLGDTYLLLICLNYALQMSIDPMKIALH